MKKFFAIITLLSLCGCSVGMAVSGKKDPDLSVIKVGSTRGEVEIQLGAPKASTVLEDGSQVCTYEFELGNQPSTGRAIGYAVLDFFTLGLWEIAGTPIEKSVGEKREVTITYDKNDCVKSIAPAAPNK